MVCFYCNQEGRPTPEVGNCRKCSKNACSYRDYSHGEDCMHCQIFYCYRDQHNHALRKKIDSIASFPKTAENAAKLSIKMLSRREQYLPSMNEEDALYQQKLEIEHALYLCRKFGDRKLTRQMNLFAKIVLNTKLFQPKTNERMEESFELNRVIRPYQSEVDILASQLREKIISHSKERKIRII